MASQREQSALPDGVFSLLDTDLYKLTMQSAVLKYFPHINVTYNLTNRTPDMKLSKRAFDWLQTQIERLGNITLSQEELDYLEKNCKYLNQPYLHYLSTFRLRPSEQVHAKFVPDNENADENDGDQRGNIELYTNGPWVETILYEIPLLALTSEAYFKFCDRDWSYENQLESARDKGLKLLEAGCMVSEFGSRRRRDYHTQELVLKGLIQANEDGKEKGYKGKIVGTSNVHFAKRFGVAPIGTVAHEWFMGVAAVMGNYAAATEVALSYWLGTFGKGVLGIALTDTFGTPSFLRAFSRAIPTYTTTGRGGATVTQSSHTNPGVATTDSISTIEPPLQHSNHTTNGTADASTQPERYLDVFTGVRQDSGDPLTFIDTMRAYYAEQRIDLASNPRTIVFSDSLNVDRCIELRAAAEQAGFAPSFGVGTFFTNDFCRASNGGEKSAPLNIVIKLSSADGKPAVKISDNVGKNTGDSETVREVKRELGYEEVEWEGGDEERRWD